MRVAAKSLRRFERPDDRYGHEILFLRSAKKTDAAGGISLLLGTRQLSNCGKRDNWRTDKLPA